MRHSARDPYSCNPAPVPQYQSRLTQSPSFTPFYPQPHPHPPESGFAKNAAAPKPSRKTRVIPPGYDVQFNVIPTVEVDATSEIFVTQWLDENKTPSAAVPDIQYYDVPGTTSKRAVLNFVINNDSLCAVGQSKKKKVAKIACYMHAMSLIYHCQSREASSTRPPPPLEVSEQPVLLQGSAWRGEAQAANDKWQYYRRLEIPPSANPVVNEATEAMRNEAKGMIPDALGSLNNIIAGASTQLIAVPVAKDIHVVTYVIDASSNLIATGIAQNAKVAKSRCAAHALHILRICSGQKSSPNGPSMCTLASNACHSSSLHAIVASLPRHNQLLFRFLRCLFNIAPQRVFEQKMREDGAAEVQCTVTLEGVRCTASAPSSFEAERSALDNSISSMQLCDERVAALNTFVSCYPSVQPETIPSASLTQSLCKKILELAAEEAALFPQLPSHQEGNGSPATIGLTEEDRRVSSLAEAPQSNPTCAARMSRELSARYQNPLYLEKFHSRRSTLAMAQVRQQLLQTVHTHQVTVIAGTTGCGKTTQVPQYLLDDAIERNEGDRCRIIVTQPRRLSTYSVAHRIASERLSVVGEDVGYAVRFDTVLGRHINICTSGVLLQILSHHPHLEHVTHLILDEVHERDINCDVILALVKEVVKFNPHIRVLLMSATIEAELFSNYFSRAPIIKVEGAVYPVSMQYLEDIQQMMGEDSRQFASLQAAAQSNTEFDQARRGCPPFPPKLIDYDLIAALVHRSIEYHLQGSQSNKSILVFLPGWKELVAAKKAIEACWNGRSPCHIILLHSSVDSQLQRACFLPAPKGYYKVVLATNIAESGITIDDVAVVIDSGLIKESAWVNHNQHKAKAFTSSGLVNDSGYGHSAFMSTQLTLKYASRANCTQRSGRAGRTQGGVCYRLFSRAIESTMRLFPEAEIHRVPLSQVILKCLSLNHPPRSFLREFIEPPNEHHVAVSITQLQHLGAVTPLPLEELTPLGLYLSRLPCDPRLGKIIIMGAVLKCLDSALTVAATTDVTPFITNRQIASDVSKQRYLLSRRTQSDPITSLNAYNAYCANDGDPLFAQHNYLNVRQLFHISQYKQQYRDILLRSGFIRNSDLAEQKNQSFSSVSTYSAEDVGISLQDCRRPGGLLVDTSPLSQHSLDIPLIKACVASSLFPNIAVLQTSQRKNSKKVTLRTRTIPFVMPGSGSVCRRVGGPHQRMSNGKDFLSSLAQKDAAEQESKLPAMFYVYQDVFRVEETRTQFLRDVSSISVWALLLFCGSRQSFISYIPVLGVGVIDNWIAIRIDQQSFNALSELRRVTDDCLRRKYRNPNDECNNAFLEKVRDICRVVLHAPPMDGADADLGRSLTDSGSIVSPFKRMAADQIEREMIREEDVEEEGEDFGSDEFTNLYGRQG